MKINMGIADRLIRILIAVVIVILYYSGVINGTFAIIALVVAAIFVITSFISVCPLYLPFGISTKKKT